MCAIIRDSESDWRKPCSALFPTEVGGTVKSNAPKRAPVAAKTGDIQTQVEGMTQLVMPPGDSKTNGKSEAPPQPPMKEAMQAATSSAQIACKLPRPRAKTT